MIRVVSYSTPEDAARRLCFLGVPDAAAARLAADLRPYILRLPPGRPDFAALAAEAAARGIPVAAGSGGWFLAVSATDQLEKWMREAPASATRVAPLLLALRRYLERDFAVPCRDRLLRLGREPVIMGILNVTPDSFFDGGRYASAKRAVRRGIEMFEEGAKIIDVGGESTRPGSVGVPAEEQIRRVVPVIKELAAATEAILSVDTTSAAVARAAAEAGAAIVNDTGALRDDPEMASAVRDTGCAVVLMHRKGIPATMQAAPFYESLFDEILEFWHERIGAAVEAGIPSERILVDPGIGFGKRHDDNLALHRHIAELHNTGRPIVFGPSRKSFLGAVTGRPPAERAFATAASVALAVAGGAHVLRVHDVKEMWDAARVAWAVREGREC